ncbi:hypothetical protein [Dactylosporangium sp. NPDC005555]|uniref:hypothetical protein n=1 Tax=Dactylosporangium sp. NPDC005555 TaxID=3154889 RepID=UPI0033A9D0F1
MRRDQPALRLQTGHLIEEPACRRGTPGATALTRSVTSRIAAARASASAAGRRGPGRRPPPAPSPTRLARARR